MNEDHSITIPGRGEGLDYRDEDGIFHFELDHQGATVLLHSYACRREASLPRKISEEQRGRIIPRIVSYLSRRGSRVKLLSKKPPPLPHPLRSVDEVSQERLRQREQSDAARKMVPFFKRLFGR